MLFHSLHVKFIGGKQLYKMAARTLRRRLHHGDVDGRSNEHVDISSIDSLNEPLLGKHSFDRRQSEVRIISIG